MNSTHARIYFILQKSATTIAYISLIVLTLRFLEGHLDWTFAAGCTILSGFWCLLTRVKMSHFLHTYFDVFSRLEVVVPCIAGLVLSATSMFSPATATTHTIDGAELLLWISLIFLYEKNKKQYAKQGYGPLPKGTWISPPMSMMKPGDLVLTSGNVAKRLHESVGHAAAIVLIDGELKALSSHMDRGATLDPIFQEIGQVVGIYILMHLAEPPTPEQIEKMGVVAQQMHNENLEWRAKRNQAWGEFVNRLPLSLALKQKLRDKYYCSGYDWAGMFLGRIKSDRWTCIGAAVELYKKCGIPIADYGTGLLGFGTTLFDPIMPVRFLSDPALKLVMQPEAEPQKQALLFTEQGANSL